MHKISQFFHVISATVVVTTIAGCSFSDSSKSSSDSSKGSSNSVSSIVSSPSRSSRQDLRYQDEIVDYTVAYVKSSEADYASYQKGLAEIAAREGIINWEEDPRTYIAIGMALKKAGLKGVAYETYKKNLAGGDYGKMQDIQKGYDAE